MVISPAELLALALARHQTPWNWTLHCVALFGFMLTLLFHSYLMLAVTLILFGAGFFDLGLPDSPDNRWLVFVRRRVEWEKDWIAYPWSFRKVSRFFFVLLLGCVLIWALWTGEPAALALFVGFAFLIKVLAENKAGGIDP